MFLVARHASRAAAAVRGGARRLSYAAPEESAQATVRVDFDVPYETHKLQDGGPATFTYTSKEELLEYFRDMYRMRRMEIAADTLYKGKFVKGFCHLYDGQEAIVIGMEAAQPVIGKQALARSRPMRPPAAAEACHRVGANERPRWRSAAGQPYSLPLAPTRRSATVEPCRRRRPSTTA